MSFDLCRMTREEFADAMGERLLNAFVGETVRLLRKHPPGGAR